MQNRPSLWTRHAQHWDHVRAPLRPSGLDLQWAQESVNRVASTGRSSIALVLGVTPELCDLRWPNQTRLLAADSSLSMIQSQWSDDPHSKASPVQAGWTSLPMADQACDLVMGDGCFVLLHGNGPTNLVRSVHRVLKPGGRFHIRVFVRPDLRESPDAVWEELQKNRIGNFHIFKFRLLASLCNAKSEVAVADAHRYFSLHCPDHMALGRQLDWPIDEIRTVEAYRDQPAVYWYPTMREFRAKFVESFEELDCRWPDYEMGDRCPTFILSPR